MTNAPADLLAVRRAVMALTGVSDPADMGIVGDEAHAASGGYHEGRDSLTRAGVVNTDYSVVEYARDRAGLTDSASAFDMALAWSPRAGGRAAAIRATNLLVDDLRGGHPSMGCVRAMNYTPDGTAKRRIDRRNGFAVTSSGDSVDIHTHFEFFRDTEGQRAGAFLDLVRARILQAQGRDDMLASDPDGVWLYPRVEGMALLAPPAEGPEKGKTLPFVAAIKRIDAGIASLLAAPATLSDAQVQAIADRLVASGANGLTAADHAAVVEDVKAALRAGTA
jgi:hypothetical protein